MVLVCWATNATHSNKKKMFVKKLTDNSQIIFSLKFISFINPNKDINDKKDKRNFDLEDINKALELIYNSKKYKLHLDSID